MSDTKLDFSNQPKLKVSSGLELEVDKNYIQYAARKWQDNCPDEEFENILSAEEYYPPKS